MAYTSTALWKAVKVGGVYTRISAVCGLCDLLIETCDL